MSFARACAALLALALCSTDVAADDVNVDETAAAFRAKVAVNAIELDYDPYDRAARSGALLYASAGAQRPVCALHYEDEENIRYRLETFATAEGARRAGYRVTHAGRCGTCSTLQDLAVYLSRPDLTTPVRQCAVRIVPRRALRCLGSLGFSEACALTWYYNARNTRRFCFGVCMRSWALGEPANKPDGTLNDCLRCDEEQSGAVFKAVAGRTRRNSGIRSSIERAPAENYPLIHDYR